MNMLRRDWLQFPMSATKSLKSPACQYHTPPSQWVCLANRKIPSLSSLGLYGAHLPLIAKPLILKYIGDWPATFLINWQAKLVSSLLLSGSLDPRGLGQGLVVFVLPLCQTCMIHCHLTRENKAEKWGISGLKGLFLRHSGLHYNIHKSDSFFFRFCPEHCLRSL